MFKISKEWHGQEFKRDNKSKEFWFSRTDDEEGISFLAGSGTDINKITSEMCELVYACLCLDVCTRCTNLHK
ncbi:hypothetical protein [Crocosphaera subtropica]|uniref:hypothetical protein n=1 Tax=Crocosphaera subtropica TaxID=2546360 RepID=UPI0002314E60|nr:hypothetical protein [Crocosphaera subtropica]